jgi:putative membrane protein
MWGWDGHVGWGFMGIGWLFFLILIGVVVWLAVSSSRRDGGPRAGDSRESAEEILKKRYARGEIDQETYRRMRDELRR